MGTQENLDRTRLAPTPSGFLHVGNILSFAITAKLARQHGARILLRIDDLDRQRVKKEYLQDIFDTLDFLEIPFDEGPKNLREFEQLYSQIHRLPLYRRALEQLKEQNQVFACDCSRASLLTNHSSGSYPGTCIHRGLPLEKPGLNWRLLTGIAGASFPPEMASFIVRKKDGHPSYQLASLIDDQHFNVDLIVRGQDLWPSTQAQLHLARLLDIHTFPQATFYHHRLLADAKGEKLSKSAGDLSIQLLRKQGHNRRDIFGQIGRMLHFPEPVGQWEDLAFHALASEKEQQRPDH